MPAFKEFELVTDDEAIRRKEMRQWIHPKIVLLMLGGKWPEFRGFNFDAVEYFHCENGVLVPCDDATGEPIPGPNFKLVMIDDLSSPDPIMVIPDEFYNRIETDKEYKD